MTQTSAWHRPAAALLERAIDFLRDTGLAVCEEEAIDLLDTAGAVLSRNADFVKLRPDVLRRGLERPPGAFNLYDREGHKVGTLAGGLPAGGATLLQATLPGLGRVRMTAGEPPQAPNAAQLPDIVARLAATDGFQILGCSPWPADLPPALGDLHRLYLGLLSSRHPQLLRPRDAASIDAVLHMLTELRGTREEVEAKPLVIVEAPLPRPAQIDQQTGRLLIDCARKGIPVAVVPPPRPPRGPTPGSPDGGPRERPEHWALESVAAGLAATLIHQTARRHAPLLWGMPFVQLCHPADPWREAWRAALTVGDLLGMPTYCTLAASNGRPADGACPTTGAPLWALEAALCRARVIAWGGAGGSATCLDLSRLTEHGIQAEEVPRAVELLAGEGFARTRGRAGEESSAIPLDRARRERLAEIVGREAERFGVADVPGLSAAS